MLCSKIEKQFDTQNLSYTKVMIREHWFFLSIKPKHDIKLFFDLRKLYANCTQNCPQAFIWGIVCFCTTNTSSHIKPNIKTVLKDTKPYEWRGMKQYNYNCFRLRKMILNMLWFLFLPLFGLCHTAIIYSENTVETGHM